MTKALIRMGESLCWSSLLQDVATTLSDQNQFVAHGGSGSVGDCPVQLPARAIDVTVAADGLSEA